MARCQHASRRGGDRPRHASRAAKAHPGLLTIIAPRHPERRGQDRGGSGQVLRPGRPAPLHPTLFPKGGERLSLSLSRSGASAEEQIGPGCEAAWERRATLPEPRPAADGVWLADTLGELGLLYRLSRIAFIGRSLLPPGGGQNPLEAARLGCAIAVGPHTGNFSDILRVLEGAGAVARVADAESLAAWVSAMLRDPDAREAAGRAGIAAAARYADLPARTAATLLI